jgi:hypothetical protein
MNKAIRLSTTLAPQRNQKNKPIQLDSKEPEQSLNVLSDAIRDHAKS